MRRNVEGALRDPGRHSRIKVHAPRRHAVPTTIGHRGSWFTLSVPSHRNSDGTLHTLELARTERSVPARRIVRVFGTQCTSTGHLAGRGVIEAHLPEIGVVHRRGTKAVRSGSKGAFVVRFILVVRLRLYPSLNLLFQDKEIFLRITISY